MQYQSHSPECLFPKLQNQRNSRNSTKPKQTNEHIRKETHRKTNTMITKQLQVSSVLHLADCQHHVSVVVSNLRIIRYPVQSWEHTGYPPSSVT